MNTHQIPDSDSRKSLILNCLRAVTDRLFRSSRLLGAIAMALVAGFIAAPSALAQSATSSGLTGDVRDSNGAVIADASVELRHEPTGSAYTSGVQSTGRFSLQGIRVGGPYTLTISSGGYQTTILQNIYVELANESRFDVVLNTLDAEVVELDAFVVDSGSAITIFDGGRSGTGSIINNRRVQDTATVSRSITDFARLNPLVQVNDTDRGEITAAGQNNRYNSIQVDGINLNDQFGLEPNGFSAIRNPISIDTIEEFSIDIAPYDVRRSGFTGAAINAVTKSGTNEFQGTAYYYYTDDSFRADNPSTGIGEPFEETTYGITLGGPIIKDKLFFFLNYEKFDRDAQADNPGFIPDSGDVARIIARSQALGFDPGTFETISAIQEEEKILAKIDWTISDRHRLSVRYDTNEGQQPDFGEYTDFSSSRPETALTSHFFTDSREVQTMVGELTSFWTDNLQSQIRYGNTQIDKVPTLQNPLFPEIIVNNVNGIGQNGSMTSRGEIFFGTEDSRQSNSLNSEVTNMAAHFDYFRGDLTYSFGVDSEKSEFDNLFLQDTFGNYTFGSIEDFENDELDFGVRQFGIDGQSVAAQSDFTITGLYGQAKWNVSPNLILSGGVRVDVIDTSSSPPLAQHFVDAFGIRNDETIGGESVIAPRVSFNYTPENTEGLQIRGGLGLFQGRAPAVYLSNSFSNNGVTTASNRANTGTFSLEDAVNGALTGSDAIFNFDPNNPRPDLPPGTPGNRIDLIEEGLQLPAVWRANLAIDKKLELWDMVASLEVVFTEADAELYVENINLQSVGQAPDGRTLFNGEPRRGNGVDSNFSDIYLLKNANGGSASNLVFSLTKPQSSSWYGSASYTLGDSVDTSSVTSSTAFSNFANRSVFNQNTDEVGTSNYEIKHRVLINAGYQFDWTDTMNTRISLLYDGRTGRPYSAIFSSDVNNDGLDFNDLLYVPTGPGDPLVSFASGADETAFFNYIAAEGLDQFAGSYAPRNSLRSDWVHRFDIKLTHEIALSDRFRTEFYLDMLNVGNLLNEEWGQVNQVPFNYTEDVVDADTVNGQYVYTFEDPSGPNVQPNLSRWAVQFGVRLFF